MPAVSLCELIQHCDICFEDEVISKELLLKTYAQFLSESICSEEHTVGVSLHTGSICYDLLTIVYATLSCLFFDKTTPEEIVNTLQYGDMIIYNGKTRAVFEGINEDGYARIQQITVNRGHKSPLISTIAPQNFYKIKPYKGKSTTLDGRGIRDDVNIRTSFIENVFGKDTTDISATVNKSVIIVGNRETIDRIVRGTIIKFDGTKSIQLTELVTVTYYTENDEYTYGGNPGKIDPVLKFMNKVSLAREHIIQDEDNKNIGLVVLGKQIVDAGKTEMVGLMNRRSLRYVFVCYPIEQDDNKGFIETYPDANLFACTKEFLLSCTLPSVCQSGLICDLNNRIDNIIEKDIEIAEIEGDISWEIYKNTKRGIHFIKNNEYSNEDTEYFVIHSFSLLNLFATAVFPISYMENAILNGTIGCLSPKEQMNKLSKIAEKFTGIIGDKMNSVCLTLQRMHGELFNANNKYEFIKQRLANNRSGKRRALVVPKAFYKTLVHDMFEKEEFTGPRLDIETGTKFDASKLYDEIIVLGAFKNKGFNEFTTTSSAKIIVLLYPYETVLHNVKLREHKKVEHQYNKHSYVSLELDEEDVEEKPENISEGSTINEIDVDLKKYIEEITIRGALNSIGGLGTGSSAGIMADIVRVATLDDGDKVFFSKYYTPYILDREESTVVEANVKDLSPGDILIFTKQTEQAKDIVDVIIYKMLSSKSIEDDMHEAFRKSKHWKNALRQYMHDNGVSFKDVENKMSNYGTTKHVATMRSWLNGESHIIGPRDKDSYYQIAMICEDREMLADPESFWNACNIIRSLRIRILKLIGTSIIQSFRGIQDETDEYLSVVEEKVSKLSHVVQVETITDVEGVKVPAHLANRPYSI